MKRFLSVLIVIAICICCLCGCKTNSSVVRIHIRANSNNVCDQEVKLSVSDGVINYITPLIISCKNSNEVKIVLGNILSDIENVADEILKDNGFDYCSKADIRNELFPEKEYDGVVFPSDYYDALVIELGAGVGDNWWCVAYPPLCFVGEDIEGNQIKYKSKLMEMINKFFA